MKIVYCISSILNSGGLQRVLAIKANYFADILGHEVIIVTTDNGHGQPFFHFSPKIKIVDLGVTYMGYSFMQKIINRLNSRRLLKKKLEKALVELKPDITISVFQNEAALLPSIKDGSIKVIENHNCRYFRLLRDEKFPEKFVSWIRSYNDYKIIRKYDAFVTLTHEDKLDWPDNKNIHVIHNPLTINCADRASFKSKRVIAAGRITHQKGYDNLIKAWSIVEHKHPDWELMIIGSHDDTNYVNYVKTIIQDLDLKNVVLKKTTKSVEDEYLKSNILVMTSNYEGFGLVLTEAMSMGLPIVSFDCKCGPSDIIKDGENGFLVKDKNIGEFANRVCQLIDDKELHARMSVKALEYSKLYDVNNIMKQWMDLFEELLEYKVKK